MVLFIIAKIWKQSKCPSVDEWIKMVWYTYTMEFYTAGKRRNSAFATVWMDLETIMISEINQSVKDKCCMISLMCGIFQTK